MFSVLHSVLLKLTALHLRVVNGVLIKQLINKHSSFRGLGSLANEADLKSSFRTQNIQSRAIKRNFDGYCTR